MDVNDRANLASQAPLPYPRLYWQYRVRLFAKPLWTLKARKYSVETNFGKSENFGLVSHL